MLAKSYSKTSERKLILAINLDLQAAKPRQREFMNSLFWASVNAGAKILGWRDSVPLIDFLTETKHILNI